MAAPTLTNGDMPVTIKLNVDGFSRRLKLPLRDLTRETLEPKLRQFLELPEDVNALFERYSDSAAAYIVLDRRNLSIYKQLGRAAKAKQKLKIRVTTIRPAVEEPTNGPKPASVEDAAEEEVPAENTEVAPAPPMAQRPLASPAPQTSDLASLINAAEDCQVKSQDALDNTLRAIHHSIASASAATNIPAYIDCAAASDTNSAQISRAPSTVSGRTTRTTFAVCCNSCDSTIPEVHYHCSTCDDGDFDLCQECVDQGITCYGANHWLIKRFVKNGQITPSTTERIAPKVKAASAKAEEPALAPAAAPQIAPQTAPQDVPVVPEAAPEVAPQVAPQTATVVPAPSRVVPVFEDFLYSSIRTCNCCVQELSEANFVHCTTCEDFDLCRPCFAKNRHGHHPKHGFVPAVEGTRLEYEVSRRLNPGRGQEHNAICDGCDEEIRGIRHKCLDCPDWDYCSTCIPNALFIHPHHRFVPIYEKLEPSSHAQIRALERATHHGICCDGPLCSNSQSASMYIVGDRYKCAICDDTDFCANCEASPNNTHNATHPLIKFKTSVRHVNITTSVEHKNGRSMPMMGDRLRIPPSPPAAMREKSRQTPVQTVVDVKPSAPVADKPQFESEKGLAPAIPEKIPEEPVEPEAKVEENKPSPVTAEKVVQQPDLVATFIRDAVPDNTIMGSDQVFRQTWVLRNDGTTSWPAGCSVKYVGGDYMGHLDANRPAATHELESSSESTSSVVAVAPGEEHCFSVMLRTPQRTGRVVSNWRLTTSDGLKFGHRLWCDVIVRNDKPPVSPEPEQVRSEPSVPVQADAAEVSIPVKQEQAEPRYSQMIFPKLEKESPESSIHESGVPAVPAVADAPVADASAKSEEEYDGMSEDSWVEDDSFLTDEEYDILDASDEESQHNTQ
ncbi:next to BRCA1 gene 1 protein [Podospora conica]|nr:next to BRCA1 gene 1 protein [Schizothecium conicum]